MVDDARQARLTTLLVQVRGRDDAYYRSDVVPLAEQLQRGQTLYDPLRLAIEKGHEAGLEVHAWVNLCIAWSAPHAPREANHVLLKHPEWLAQPFPGTDLDASYSGETWQLGPHWRFLSPAIPQARDYLLEVVTEIVQRYDVDGIHLDYVRYPDERFDYGPIAAERFQEQCGVDPRELYRLRRQGTISAQTSRLWDTWVRWRADQVTDLVRAIAEMIRSTKPGVSLSAAVKPDVDQAYEEFGQAWPEWVNTGLVDFVVPMMYAPQTAAVLQQTLRVQALVPPSKLCAGLGLFDRPLSSALDKIQSLRDAGVLGFALFSYSDLKGQLEAFVASGVLPAEAPAFGGQRSTKPVDDESQPEGVDPDRAEER